MVNEALHAPVSSENYQQLFADAPAPIAIFSGRELRYAFVNDAYAAVFNYRNILGKTVREAFPELEGQSFFSILEEVYDTGVPFKAQEIEAEIDHLNNGTRVKRYYNLVYSPFKNVTGAIEGVMAFGHDVTSQVEAKNAEHQNNIRFRNLVERSIDPILILKGEELVLDVANQALLNLLQVDDAAFGKPFLQILPEMENQVFFTLLREVYTTGETRNGYEVPGIFKRTDGRTETGYFNFNYQPYREIDNTISGVMVTATDVTAHVLAKRRLAESEERLRLAVELVEMGTWDYDPVTEIIHCSDRTKEIFGFSKNRVTLNETIKAISEKDRDSVSTAIVNALNPKGNGRYQIEYAIVRLNDNNARIIKATGQAYFKDNRAIRFIGTVLDITDENKIRVEQQKLLALVDNSIELMSILELDGKNSYLNKAGMQMLGFRDMKQVLETPIHDLHTPEDIAFVESNVLPSVMQTGKWSGSMMVRHLVTGERFPVYNNTVRIDDPHTGIPSAIGAVMRDMRQELAAQKALIESEENFRNIVLQAPVAICVLHGTEHVVEVANERMYQIWGTTEETALNKPLFHAVPEAAGQGLEQLLSNVYATGTTYRADERMVNLPRNGVLENVYLNFVYHPLRNGQGNINRIMAIAIDVTEQVLSREQIRYAEEQARLAINAAGLGTFELDILTQEIHANNRTHEIFGFDRPATRSEMTSAIHPEDLHLRNEAVQIALETGNLYFELRVVWRDNTVHWIKVNGQLFKSDMGEPWKLSGIVQDITQQKEFSNELHNQVNERTKELSLANQELQRINKELEQFAHIASHDLQEPLRKIRLFGHLVKESDYEKLEPVSRERFDKMILAADRMSTSLTDILNYTNLDNPSAFVAVDLNEIINAVEQDLEVVIAQKRACIEASNMPTVQAIPLQMQQLFYNLLNNSLKFSKEDIAPVIRIECEIRSGEDFLNDGINAQQHYWYLRVSDNGIGFKQEQSEKIFSMFYRLHDKKSYSGTGIGLALCKKVAQNHQGEIFATSVPGEGTTFHILLPK